MTESDDTALWRSWRDAVRRSSVDAAMRDIYGRIDREVVSRGPVCWASGRCCKFDEFGHRLYVTGLEAAWAAHHHINSDKHEAQASVPRIPALRVLRATLESDIAFDPARPRGGCAFQIDGLCTLRALRPMGCRLFFCDRAAEAWQHDLYERFLAELRALHDREGVAYRYMDWRVALRGAWG